LANGEIIMKKFLLLAGTALLAAAVYGQAPGGGFSGNSQALSEGRIKSEMAMMVMEGIIPLRFVNALNGQGISGGLLSVSGAGDFITDGRGIVQLPQIPDGTYTALFSKEGFITTPFEFRVQLGMVIFNWFSVSPGLDGKAWRFVLDWGERPADLDIHLEKRGDYHISYGNMRTTSDGNANLDRDDRDGFGPETITVKEMEETAVYDLYIVDYSNRQSPGSTMLSRSGAVLRVYRENHLAHSFPVPPEAGVRWNVFRIEGNRIQTSNTMTR
jgi:hypothetical protein